MPSLTAQVAALEHTGGVDDGACARRLELAELGRQGVEHLGAVDTGRFASTP
jgi:hypothetical protein